MAKLPVIQTQVQREFRRIRRRSDMRDNATMPIPGMEPLVMDSNPKTGLGWYRYAVVPQKWILAYPSRRGTDWLFLPFDRIAWAESGVGSLAFDPLPSPVRTAPHIPGDPDRYRGHWLVRAPRAIEPPGLPKEKSPLFLIRNQSMLWPAAERHFGTDGTVWATRVRVRAVSDTGIWFTNPAPPKAIHDPDFVRAMKIKGLPGDEISKIQPYE